MEFETYWYEMPYTEEQPNQNMAEGSYLQDFRWSFQLMPKFI